MSLSANGMASKAKAMYGKHLSKYDYEELLKKHSVGEVANYLKNNTYYSETLKDVKENSVHRGQLENLLRRSSFDRRVRLHRYADYNTKEFYKCSIELAEINQVLACIRALMSDDYTSFIAELPLYLNPYTSYDLNEFLSVKRISDLKKVLKSTKYYENLNPFLNDENMDYAECEHALMVYYYKHMKDIVNKKYHGKSKKELLSMIDEMIELKNISKIYRMKKYFDGTPEEIKKVLLECKNLMNKERYEKVLNANSSSEVVKILAESTYNIELDEESFLHIEDYINRIQYDLAKKCMNFSTNPSVIYLAYFILDDIELTNLINIVEGIRYNVSPSKIEQLIIY